MTTSSTYTYQLTRDQLLTASLRKLGVIAEGQTPSAQNLADGQIALNSAIAEFRTKGMSLWARNEYTFTPTTSSYSIGEGLTLDTPFPLKVFQAFRTDTSTKIPMELVAREDFNILPANTSGSPLKLCYQPFVNYGTLSIWPTPSASNTSTVTIVYQRPFQYFTTGTETMDFPEEWYNAIVYKVAALLAPEWGIPLQDRQMLMSESKQYLEEALDNSYEDASFYITPERRR